MNIIYDVPPVIDKNTFVAIDTEWFGIDQTTLHRPTSGKFACLTVCFDPEIVYMITDENKVSSALANIDEGIWIGHNIKFDIIHLRRFVNIPPRNKIWDTMLIDKIMWGGYYDLFGLDDLSRRYLDLYLDKEIQKSFYEDCSSLSEEQKLYAALDCSITLQVALKQRKVMDGNDLRIWKDVDRAAMWALMDFRGFRVDVEKWNVLARLNKQRQLDIDASLLFNPRSAKVAKEYLTKRGFVKLPNTQEKTLLAWLYKFPDCEAAEITKQILESRKYSKRASTYGVKFIEKHLEKEGDIDVIHCDYWVTGAETGRMSSSSPNMQNIPTKDTREFRECFIARPGNKLVIGDYSAQEPGITGYTSKDTQLIEIFNSGEDIYIQAAQRVFNEAIKGKKDPRRKKMKAIILGLSYGMTEYGLARNENMSVKEAKALIDRFLRIFSGFKIYMNKQQANRRQVRTVLGRKIWLNPYSNQCERNALNSPIQGTAGDMLKKALGIMYQNWNFDYPFACVEITHDEIGFDVPEAIAKEVQSFVNNIMVQVANEMCPGMKFRADVVICDSWADKE